MGAAGRCAVIELADFIGSFFILGCAVIGAFILLRWGVTGVALLWSKRREIDLAVRDDLELTFPRRGWR
jgi:hypothetical protein